MVLALRGQMMQHGLDAYLVVMTDEHGSYSGTGYDARVAHISGFTGSSGWAVVTRDKAALWTDGRYFLQADQQMDCNWILMQLGTTGYPQTTWDWLKDVLPSGSKLGAFPNINSQSTWFSHVTNLALYNINMEAVKEDLVDLIWTTDRPPRPNNHLIVHDLNFAGKLWTDKLHETRVKVAESGADVLVVTVLEQVAWLFNLRGSDKSASLFYGYAIIYEDTSSLYVQNTVKLMSSEVQSHLEVHANGTCWYPTSIYCVNVYEYDHVYNDIQRIQTDKTIWVDPTANQAIYNATTAAKPYNIKTSPIELMKSIKNEQERRHFAECIKRDSAAVVEFAAFLEKEMEAGRQWTEVSAADKINSIRANYTNNKGLSFRTISAFGANAAVIHYRPEAETDTRIDTSNVYLLDSGGQYLDGTTDVTRTFHYGTPTEHVKEAYTRVLMGQIDLAQTVWTEGMYGYELDVRARYPLYQNGWDFNHGTGHGIGYYLSVHEGPGRINRGYNPTHEPLYEGMFFSDEPGYYEDGNFGIRLENLMTVVRANTTTDKWGKFLTFRTLTLVPYEPKLINYDLLTSAQRSWLEEYNRRCLEEIGSYLHDERNNHDAYMWLVARTTTEDGSVSASPQTFTPAVQQVFVTSLLASFFVTMTTIR